MRRSLFARLLGMSALVALCSIAATTWLAVQTTSGAIRQEQGQAIEDDGRIYRGILEYAATHSGWDGVGDLARSYAEQTDRRIALTNPDGSTIVDTAAGGEPLPREPSAVVDPLSVDAGLGVPATADRIAPQAVGPYALPDEERTTLHQFAERVLACVRERAGGGRLTIRPGGHPEVVAADSAVLSSCSAQRLSEPSSTERAALGELTDLVDRCLARRDAAPVRMRLDFGWTRTAQPSQATSESLRRATRRATRECVTAGRREQLTPYVSPSALLYLTGPTPEDVGGFALSRDNRLRLMALAGGILVLSVVVTALAGLGLVRPLRALTAAAQRMGDGTVSERVEVRGRDEIARLGTAFNEMADSRERLDRARREMVGDIAHELRTPLSNIRGWVEAAQDGVAESDAELLDSLHEEAVHLQHLVADLQDLALADAGELRIHPEPLDASLVLDQVSAAHDASARAAGVVLSVRSSRRHRMVADPMRLRQAIDNLVSNAIRHTSRGGTVTIDARRDGEYVVVDVTDTGDGIGERDLPHVFDRFWRADKSRGRDAGGSGLGLAIVRRLAELHGGTVTAVSAPGQGSTFTLRLPLNPPGSPVPADTTDP